MSRAQSTALLTRVRDLLLQRQQGQVGIMGSSLVLNGRPVAFIAPDNAIVVHAADLPAATYRGEDSEHAIAALVIARFGVGSMGRAA